MTAKLLVIAPRLKLGTGPSNSLLFINYLHKLEPNIEIHVFYTEDLQTIEKLIRQNILVFFGKSLSRNHYAISSMINKLVLRYNYNAIITISPEYLILLSDRYLGKAVAIPQGTLELEYVKRKPIAFMSIPSHLEIFSIARKLYAFLAISKCEYHRILKIYRPRRIALIYNPVDSAFFTIGKQKLQKSVNLNELRLLYVGVLARWKGVHRLIDWFPEIKKEFKNVKIDIVGSGPLEHYLREKIKRLNFQKYITLYGYIPHENLPKLYEKATLLITPSYSESFSIPVAEAAATATPSVVRLTFALKEHVELGYAVGYHEDDAQQVVKAIDKALDNYERLRIRGFNIAKTLFHAEKVAGRVLRVLSSIPVEQR